MAFLRCMILLLIIWVVGTKGADIQTFYLDTELCNQKINMSSYDDQDLHSFRLKLSKQHYYPHNLDCQLQIQAQRDSENIMFYFKYFDVRPYAKPESGCYYDWLEIHDGNSTDSPYVCGIDMKLCGISPPRAKGVYFTRSHFLTLYFKSDDQEKYTGFEMIITRFRYGQCRSDEYECANGRCIDESLKCNGYNPCGDKSDCNSQGLHPGYITSIVLAIVIFLIFIIILANWLYRKHKLKKIVPEDMKRLTCNSGTDCPSLQEGLPQLYGTAEQQLNILKPNSNDHSNQAPLNSIRDPPSTYLSSHFGGTQSQSLPGGIPTNRAGKSFKHSSSSKRKYRHLSETHNQTGDATRSNTEPTLEECTLDEDATYPKRVC